MLIFPNEESQLLYEKGTPNDVLQKGEEWARLYLGAHGGSILVMQPDGSIDHFIYTADDAIYDAWLTFERQIEVRQPNFQTDHAIFQVPHLAMWAWTRPLPPQEEESEDFVEGSCLITLFQEREQAITEMLSYYDELKEWWESDGEHWRLTYTTEPD